MALMIIVVISSESGRCLEGVSSSVMTELRAGERAGESNAVTIYQAAFDSEISIKRQQIDRWRCEERGVHLSSNRWSVGIKTAKSFKHSFALI